MDHPRSAGEIATRSDAAERAPLAADIHRGEVLSTGSDASALSPAGAPALTPLLVRFGRMGDMVLQAPLLHLLRRRYGHPCILLSAGSWSSALFDGDEDVSEVWQLRERHTPYALSPERWALVRRLRRCSGPIYVSDDVAEQRRRIRALLARANIGEERCVFIEPHAGDVVHWVDRLLEFGKLTPRAFDAAAYAWREADLRRAPQLSVHAADRRDLDAWLRRRGFNDAPLVLIQPGNNRTNRRRASRRADAKAWPLERWAHVMRSIRMRDPATCFILCGGERETAMLDDIRRHCAIDRVGVATRDLPLRRLLALSERAHSMIAVDTGPAHVAAAAGCPLLVLYGEDPPARWDRRSPNGSTVINLGGPPLHSRVDQISADEVVANWQRLVRAGS